MPPIDPRIALGVQPIQLPNVLAQYAQMAQIQNAQMGNALTAAKMRQLEREYEKERALAAAVAASGGNLESVLAAALKQGNIGAAVKLSPLIEALHKQAVGQPIGSGGLYMPDKTIIPPAARPETSPIGKPSPGDFTPESLAKYAQTKDWNDLVRQAPQRAPVLQEFRFGGTDDKPIMRKGWLYPGQTTPIWVGEPYRPQKQIPAAVTVNPAVQPLYKRNKETGTLDAIDARTGRTLAQDVEPAGAVTLDIRDKQINRRQIAGQYAQETRMERNSLAALQNYERARASGDNGQAAQWASQTVRAAIGMGSARFRGDAEKLLGQGYGSGSIIERLGNFLNTEAVGMPSPKTMEKLDNLVKAARVAAMDNLSMRTQFHANRASGLGLSLKETLGEPFVSGTYVVFPNGTLANFPSAKAANEAKAKWREAE